MVRVACDIGYRETTNTVEGEGDTVRPAIGCESAVEDVVERILGSVVTDRRDARAQLTERKHFVVVHAERLGEDESDTGRGVEVNVLIFRQGVELFSNVR